MPSAPLTCEVLVVGGGLAGLSLAALLAQSGVDTVCVDKEDPARQLAEKFDGRTTAISLASSRILAAAGVWPLIEKDCAPILDIRVADGKSPFFLHFDSAEAGLEPFGWIIENRLLRQALLRHAADAVNLGHWAPAGAVAFSRQGSWISATLDDGRVVRCKLMVAADGRNSAVRQWAGIAVRGRDYGQTAIVCAVEHELDHENVAVEHFMPEGPFAILPMTRDARGRHRSSVVWTVHGGDAGALLKLPEEDFNALLQNRFGPHLGMVRAVGLRMAYPLRIMHARSDSAPRVALVAEALHVMHPIAGQGLNMSLRDVAVLARLVRRYKGLGLDIGSAALLTDYGRARRADNTGMLAATDSLNLLFSNDIFVIRGMRGLGLGLVEVLPPVKKFFMRQAMGTAGRSWDPAHDDGL